MELGIYVIATEPMTFFASSVSSISLSLCAFICNVVVRQQIGKHVCSARDAHSRTEELLEFPMES
jgi:hypothetical protein